MHLRVIFSCLHIKYYNVIALIKYNKYILTVPVRFGTSHYQITNNNKLYETNITFLFLIN
jgi:hypothetical protein